MKKELVLLVVTTLVGISLGVVMFMNLPAFRDEGISDAEWEEHMERTRQQIAAACARPRTKFVSDSLGAIGILSIQFSGADGYFVFEQESWYAGALRLEELHAKTKAGALEQVAITPDDPHPIRECRFTSVEDYAEKLRKAYEAEKAAEEAKSE